VAVFPDRIVLKNSTDSQAAIEAAIGSGGTDQITQGEVVVGLEANAATFYTIDGTGNVVTIGSAAGSISTLGDLTDVDLTTPATDGQVIAYNSTSGNWEPVDQSGGLANIVEDLTPQLGGDLDVNGYHIVSASGGDVVVAPNTTGDFVVRGNSTDGSITLNCTANTHGVTIQSPPHADAATYTLILPSSVGTAGQVLTSQGGAQLTWENAGGGATSINDLTDVDTSTTPPANDQALIWNGTTWVPGDVAAGSGAVDSVNGQTGDVTLVIDDLTDVTTAGVEAGWVLNFEYPDGTNSGVSNEGTIAYSDFNWNSCDISTDVAKFGSGSVDLRNSLAFLRAGTNFTSVEENSLAFGTGDFTVEAWVYWTTVASGSLHVIWEYNNSTASIGHFLHWNGLANTFTVRIQGGTTQTSSVVNLADATWHHLAVTRSSSTVQLFVNGTSVLSYTDGGNITGSLKSLLLGGGRNSGQNLGGYMDGFRLIKGTAVYTSNFTPPTAPPESFTPPADGQVLTWVDANSRWEPADAPADAVTSVNGETGALYLGLRDLSDVSTATGGTPFRYNNEVAGSASVVADGDWVYTSGIIVFDHIDADGQDATTGLYNQLPATGNPSSGSIWVSTDGVTFTEEAYTATFDFGGTGTRYGIAIATSYSGSGEIWIAATEPITQASDGQVLTWVDANSRWEPAAPSLRSSADFDGVILEDGAGLIYDSINGIFKQNQTPADSLQAMAYKFKNTTSGDPGSGNVALNNSNPTLATEIRANKTTENGVDMTFIFDMAVGAAQALYIQRKDNASEAHAFRTTGPAVDSGAYISVPVEHVTGTGTFTNNKSMMVGVYASGVAGALSSVSVPSTATSTGTAGDIRYDAGYVYVCVATNTWKRAALTSW
jgi:hypothetical protein